MSEADKAMIEKRSQLLARVALTRGLHVDVHPFSDSPDTGIDFIGTIRPNPEDKVQGFLPFAVLVWGTAKELATEEEATKYARSQKKMHLQKTEFFMPVIVLLFSMQQDKAYCAWLVKPSKDSTKLVHLKDLDFTLFDRKELNSTVSSIKEWYERMTPTIVGQPHRQTA
jgi:hypothetical protein